MASTEALPPRQDNKTTNMTLPQPFHVSHSELVNTQPQGFDNPSQGQLSWHTLVSAPSTPSSQLTAGIGVCPPRKGSLSLHRHDQAEIYHVLDGRAIVTINGTKHDVGKGSTLFIPGNAEHGVVNKNDEDFRWFYVFAADSFSEIVYRFSEGKDA